MCLQVQFVTAKYVYGIIEKYQVGYLIENIYDINNYAPRITDLKNNEQMVHNLGHIDCSKVISPYFNIINKLIFLNF